MRKQEYGFWFITGSQFLYGPETLAQVEENSKEIVDTLNKSGKLPYGLSYRGTMKTAEEIEVKIKEANQAEDCAGIVTFCHTFSPSKMWINGLNILQKPYLHFHTQFNREIPNEGIDMDYMNLHQSAHGDREHGYIGARMRLARKVIAGYWQDEKTQVQIGKWMRVAIGAAVSKKLKVMRFGDNMREVAVTEGDKVEAQIKFGWQVNTWPVGLLAERVALVSEEEAQAQVAEYRKKYSFNSEDLAAIMYQAKAELAIKALLEEEGCQAYSDTFEDLYDLKQLPGLATQDLMSLGYGFGAEGDWKQAALTAIVKAMNEGEKGGTTFMEDYTYDIKRGLCLGSHMLEICPSIAAEKAKIEVHPLGIGGKEAPARLVFEGKAQKAVLITMIDLGQRFRMIVHDVECVKSPLTMPNLPVARVMWRPEPDLASGAQCWILAGGTHHAVLSYDCDAEMMRDWARMMDIEFVHINKNSDPVELEKELTIADLVWKLKS